MFGNSSGPNHFAPNDFNIDIHLGLWVHKHTLLWSSPLDNTEPLESNWFGWYRLIACELDPTLY